MNQEQFETYLIQDLDLKIVEQEICTCENRNHCIYRSECTCCNPFDTTIYKRECCVECLVREFYAAACGGHYKAMKTFHDGELVVQMSPEAEEAGFWVYKDEFESASDRFMSVLDEYIVDLNKEQLKEVMFTVLKLSGAIKKFAVKVDDVDSN